MGSPAAVTPSSSHPQTKLPRRRITELSHQPQLGKLCGEQLLVMPVILVARVRAHHKVLDKIGIAYMTIYIHSTYQRIWTNTVNMVWSKH